MYVSNESPQDVYFGDLTVRHITSPLVEEKAYYPFGLVLGAISSRAVLKAKTAYAYNAGSEWEENGVEYYHTFFRKYDSQIGRFTGVDIASEEYAGLTPFQFGANNPVLFNDPLGDRLASLNTNGDSGTDSHLQDLGNDLSWERYRADWSFSNAYFEEGERNNCGGGSAWIITKAWTKEMVEKFNNDIPTLLNGFMHANMKFTCDDLVLFTVMFFAAVNHLPFIWQTESGIYDASSTEIKDAKSFMLNVMAHSGANDFLFSSNTHEFNLNNVEIGTVNVLTSIGRQRANHVQYITSVDKIGSEVVGFGIAQGNFNSLGRLLGSDNPNSFRYLGVPIQLGYYQSSTNTYFNYSNRESVSNFIGGHYNNQFRNFNFTLWNKK